MGVDTDNPCDEDDSLWNANIDYNEWELEKSQEQETTD